MRNMIIMMVELLEEIEKRPPVYRTLWIHFAPTVLPCVVFDVPGWSMLIDEFVLLMLFAMLIRIIF